MEEAREEETMEEEVVQEMEGETETTNGAVEKPGSTNRAKSDVWNHFVKKGKQ